MRVTSEVIVPWRESGDLDRRAAFGYVLRHLAAQRRVVVSDAPSEAWSRAGAFNQGASVATGEVLVFHNPDVVIPDDQLDRAISLAARHRVTVYPFTRYVELTRHATQQLYQGVTVAEYQSVMTRGCVGPVIIVPRTEFAHLGGFDERFTGWGYEDVAWTAASNVLLGHYRRVPGDCTHLWHAPMQSSSARPDEVTERNRKLAEKYRRAKTPAAVRSLLEARDVARLARVVVSETG